MEFLWILIGVVLGGVIGFFVNHFMEGKKKEQESIDAQKNLEAAKKRAEEIVNDANTKGERIVDDLKRKAQEEIKERKQEIFEHERRLLDQEKRIEDQERRIQDQENRVLEQEKRIDEQERKLTQREDTIDRRDASLIEREKHIEIKVEEINNRIKEIEHKEKVVQEKENSIDNELQRVASLSLQEARDIIIEKVESKMSIEIANLMKQKEEEAKEVCDIKAKELLCLAMAKYSQEVVTERTVSVVAIPNDEMKGRIIGREGRNIRTLEQLLGVDIIIDDTPEVISVSCFDPIRRETARLALEYLVKDGRIQPGRIEDICEKAKQDVKQSCHEAGINAAFKLGLPRINKELLDYVGRLKYRTSFTQNALEHSIQVAYLCGIMAAELGLDQYLAKRAGLLHDIGKAADFEMDGSHVEIGARLAKKYGEPDVVINAIESHHGDVESKFIISTLVQAADTLSASRPGARNETLENYIQRIEKLEEITKQFEGVQSSFAMQSGRELRIMVVPEKINDAETYKLARDIKDKIEAEMTYPGQIKVSVIRETRATEVAK